MKSQKGFTLIELLVVIAVIGLLAAIVLVSLNSARARARDARKLADFKNISTALQMYHDENGQMPANPVLGQEVCDGGPNQAEYDTLMEGLISGGFLGAVPRTPGQGTYCYYNYGGSVIGGIIVTYLENISSTTEPPFNSCRPFTNNWCSHTISSRAYCVCNPQ